MSNEIPKLCSPVSLKAISATAITKNNTEADLNRIDQDCAKYLKMMNEHTEERINANGESKRVIVIDKKRENIDEPVCSDESTNQGLFHRMTSVFRQNGGSGFNPQHLFPTTILGPVSQEDNLKDFTTLSTKEEKDIIDIVNLSLRDNTLKLDLETLSRLLRFAARDNRNILLRSVLDEMLVKGFPIDKVESDEMSALGHAILNNNFEAVNFLLNADAESKDGICSVDLKKLVVPLITNNQELVKNLVSFIGKPLEKYFKDNSERIIKAFDELKDSIIKANEEKFKSSDLSIDEVVQAIRNDIQNGSLHLDLLIEVAPFFLETIIDDMDFFKQKISMTPCMLAALLGNLEIVEKLIDKKVDITSGGPEGSSLSLPPIHIASLLGHPAIVKALLQDGKVDVNSIGPLGITPLMWATLAGNTDVVEFLLQSHARHALQMEFVEHGESMFKCNVMDLAMAFDRQEIIKTLINFRAKTDETFSDNGFKVIALLINSLMGNEENFKRLLEAGININTVGGGGLNVYTAMIGMVNKLSKLWMFKGQASNISKVNNLIAMILGKEKDFSSQEMSQIISAILIIGMPESKNQMKDEVDNFLAEKMEFFLKNGGDLSISGNTPIGPALNMAINNKNLKTAQKILLSGTDFNIVDNMGQTPLILAIGTGDFDMIELILKDIDNIDLNRTDDRGNTALMYVINKIAKNDQDREKYKELLLKLLDNGADPNIVVAANFVVNFGNAISGERPLSMIFNESDNDEILEMLLKYGADPNFNIYSNVRPFKTMTLLSDAVEKKDIDRIKILLKYGADVNFTEKKPMLLADIFGIHNKTAMRVAMDNGYTDIVQLFLENGANNYKALSIARSKLSNFGITHQKKIIGFSALTAAIAMLAQYYIESLNEEDK